MKNKKTAPKPVEMHTGKKQKNPTTNFAKDSHRAFCERCKRYNHGCPAANRKQCSL